MRYIFCYMVLLFFCNLSNIMPNIIKGLPVMLPGFGHSNLKQRPSSEMEIFHGGSFLYLYNTDHLDNFTRERTSLLSSEPGGGGVNVCVCGGPGHYIL